MNSIGEFASIDPLAYCVEINIEENDDDDEMYGNLYIPTDSYMFERISNPSILAHMEIYNILDF